MKHTVQAHDLRFSEMITAAEIQARVAQIGRSLTEKYKGTNPLFISVLNGAFVFTADLMRACEIPCEVEFVRLSSYEGLQSSGTIELLMELKADIRNRPIIVAEDIIDTGRTLHYFIQELKKREPASIAIASLLVKPEALEYALQIDYLGFEIPNKFVIGYGLDYKEQGRNLNGIYQLVEEKGG